MLILIWRPVLQADQADEYFYGDVFISDKAEIESLNSMGIDIASFKNNLARVYINIQDYDSLKGAGFQVNKVTPDDNKAGYHSFAEILSELENIALSNPDIVSLFELTRSPLDQKIMVLKISDNPNINETEPGYLFDFNIHGDEKISAEVSLCFINEIVNGYSTDQDIQSIVENTEIFVIPVLNPDGHMDHRRYNSNNVDLNRNYGWWWDGGGPAPVSEPEVKAISQLAFLENFMFAISYHSGAELVNYPFDSTPHLTPDDSLYRSISQLYGDYSGYPITNGYQWYKANGISEESYYGSNGTLSVIVEISNIKTPPAAQIPYYCSLNIPAMIQLLSLAGQGIHGIVTDSLTGNPVSAKINITQGGWPFWTDHRTGDFHRYLSAGKYSILVEANGYDPRLIENILVTDSKGASIDIELHRSEEEYHLFTAHKILSSHTPRGWSSSYKNDSLPIFALGKSDGVAFSLGSGGYIVIDMGAFTPITKIDGMDFTVYEKEVDGLQSYLVKGSSDKWCPSGDWDGWVTIGEGSGISDFDLPENVDNIRYVAIIDTSGQDPLGKTAGADIDAIEHAAKCAAPVVDFTADITWGKAPLAVNFTSLVNASPSCLLAYLWDFGDGETGENPGETHLYETPGTYSVTLTASGPGGADSKTIKDYIRVTDSGDDDDDDGRSKDIDQEEDDGGNGCCG